VKRPLKYSIARHQAGWTPSVVGVLLQQLAAGERFQYLLDGYRLLHHLLVGVEREAQAPISVLSMPLWLLFFVLFVSLWWLCR